MSPFIVEQLEGWTKQRIWEPYSRRWIVQVLRKPEHTCSESPAMQKYHEGISKWLKEL